MRNGPRACARITTTALTELKREIPHMPSACHIFPCCISSTASRRALHRRRQHQQQRRRQRRLVCKSPSRRVSAVHRSKKKKESPEGYRDQRSGVFFVLFFLDALTSNSLHTESWLHLSHAIQPLNDGPWNNQKKKKGEKKEKKRRKSSKKKERNPHTLPTRARTGNCCPSPRMNRGHLSYNCFPSHDKAIKSRQGSDSASALLAR